MTMAWIGRKLLAMGYGLVLAVAVIGALAFIGALFDGATRHRQERDYCLKGASNGLEIERCKRGN